MISVHLAWIIVLPLAIIFMHGLIIWPEVVKRKQKEHGEICKYICELHEYLSNLSLLEFHTEEIKKKLKNHSEDTISEVKSSLLAKSTVVSEILYTILFNRKIRGFNSCIQKEDYGLILDILRKDFKYGARYCEIHESNTDFEEIFSVMTNLSYEKRFWA
ncbi:hypothetical protein [Desulfofustis glycolicus]|uniref:hypothetical protein n=1 Tax=Desulfofustis glycolicus TaxID=51195 RepID=UPI001160EB5C|nr:hypothetical protein [Desulfofustis glycolicus]